MGESNESNRYNKILLFYFSINWTEAFLKWKVVLKYKIDFASNRIFVKKKRIKSVLAVDLLAVYYRIYILYSDAMVSKLLTWNRIEQPHEKFVVARPVLSMKRSSCAREQCMSRCSGGGAPQHQSRKEKKREISDTDTVQKKINDANVRAHAIYVGYARGSGSPTAAAATIRAHLDFLNCTDEISSRSLRSTSDWYFLRVIASSNFNLAVWTERNMALSRDVSV